jgi:two-component system response regulator LytT
MIYGKDDKMYIKIALCDDNRQSLCQYAKLISRIAQKHQIKMELSCFRSGEALLFQYSDAPKDVDIIYLDILMGNMDGLETARKLRDYGCGVQIVFLTSFEDYVFEAFDVSAIHYLLKEKTCEDKFEEVFLRAANNASAKEQELFAFEFNGQTGFIPIRDIIYFEIWRRIITAHCENGEKVQFYGSLEQLKNNLSDLDFARTHRSFLVHLPYISMFRPQSLLLKTGDVVPIGSRYAQPLKESFAKYLSRLQIYNQDVNRQRKSE